jgi:post-segregation antitoxin (ccd killing protein)
LKGAAVLAARAKRTISARLKVPVGKWLKITARLRKLSMSRLVEHIVEAEMVRIGPPEEGTP